MNPQQPGFGQYGEAQYGEAKPLDATQAAVYPPPVDYPQAPYGQAPYGQAPYGQTPYPAYGMYPQRRTNGMAIAALVCSLVFAPLGVIFGHVALSQIKRSGEEGRGMAIAGLVIGYVTVALGILFAAFIIVVAVIAVNEEQNRYPSSYNYSMANYSMASTTSHDIVTTANG